MNELTDDRLDTKALAERALSNAAVASQHHIIDQGHEQADEVLCEALILNIEQAINLALRAAASTSTEGAGGIYIASKTKHAERWRSLRASGVPIIATWIDEAGEGESQDLNDLWRRCLAEASGASALVVYREPDEVLKGGWVELGAAASHGVPVFAVGLREFTISKHQSIHHYDTFEEALIAALKLNPPAPKVTTDEAEERG